MGVVICQENNSPPPAGLNMPMNSNIHNPNIHLIDLIGVELGSLVEVSEGRMLRKLLSVMDMPLIPPWHVTLELYQITFGCIL